MTLPFPRRRKYGDAEITAVTALLRSGSLSEIGRGPACTSLEDAFRALTGTDHALSFNSGTASLHAALHAVGVHPDAGVAMSPMTWISAITAAFHAGSHPVFTDLAPDSPNLDPAQLNTGQHSAVLVTHAFGIPAPMEQFTHLPDPVVEDCSHAHGARYRKRPVGSWGNAGCFSLQESKAVSGGEGGVLTTNSRTLYERAMTVGHHPTRLAAELADPDLLALAPAAASYKYRIPALAAVIATEQVRTLSDRMATCAANLSYLTQLIEDRDLPLQPVSAPEDSVRGWYGAPFTLLTPITDPAALLSACKNVGVPVRALYPDWLSTPLLQRPDLIAAYWPHLRGRWTPPHPADFPRYQQFRNQTLVLKIPDVPAPAYLEQVAAALAVTRLPC
ncbi:DegT/DnrJ/EryC1/StrS family aminotransferase [Frankia sp. AvcI1]|uniref:DegT/DnrJ/EryC1/StrS family aminotransferase n=3 Tax=Frankia TaxID=1854 RepID=UPI0006EC236C|nr:DegT/DnrJ/EryC1/StrS family aminotransferase [Frankia sp. AvcI1]